MAKVQEYLGDFGRFQAYLYGLCVVVGLLGGSEGLMWTWTGYAPNARCCIPELDTNGCENATFKTNYSHIFLKDQCFYCPTIALNDTESQCTTDKYSTRGCDGDNIVWDSANDLYPNSLAKQHKLVCNNAWKEQLVWSAYTVGIGLGAALFGWLSDRIGRRKAFLIATALTVISCNLAVISSNFWVYAAFQVITGTVQNGTYLTMFIIFMEFVDGLPRTACGIWFNGVFTLGILYNVGWAMIVKDWRVLQFLAGAPSLLLIAYYWLLPESVRWSVLNGKQEAAKNVIRRAARMNKVIIPEEILEEQTKRIKFERVSVLSLFSHWRLGKNTTIVFFYFFASSMCYYGLAQNTGDFPGSPYVTNTLLALAEFPGFAIAVPMTHYWGRRPTLSSLFIVGGTACVAVGVLNDGSYSIVLVLLLALTGKMCVAAAFALIYNYSVEIFPTAVRQSATGASSVCARVGSIAAPQIRLLGDYVTPWLPFVIYGLVGVTAGVLALFLPETLNQELPETINDGINFGLKTSKLKVVDDETHSGDTNSVEPKKGFEMITKCK